MKLLWLVLLASCGPSIGDFYKDQAAKIRDPEAVADLRTLDDDKVCTQAGSCVGYLSYTDLLNSFPSDSYAHVSIMTESGKLASCITHVASYLPPTVDAMNAYLACYEPFTNDENLPEQPTFCGDCLLEGVETAKLVPLASKYGARCVAEYNGQLVTLLMAELRVDLDRTHADRDTESLNFGDHLAYDEEKVKRIATHDPAAAATVTAELHELRYGVYGPNAMTSVILLSPSVKSAARETADLTSELLTLRRATNESDLARRAHVNDRLAVLATTIAAASANYKFAEAKQDTADLKADPELAAVRTRLDEVQLQRRAIGDEPDSRERATALATEQNQLEAELAAVRKRHGVTWVVQY